VFPTATQIESLLAIRPHPWFAVPVIDKITGREFTIQMNEPSPAACEMRACEMGFAVGRIASTAGLHPDPAIEKARDEIRHEVAELFTPPDGRTLEDIYGPDVEDRLRDTFQELMPEGFLGSTPAELAKGIVSEQHVSWVESVSTLWKHFQSSARSRLRGRVFATWVKASNRECTTDDLVSVEWTDALPIDRHFLLDKLGAHLLRVDRLRAESVCWQWLAEFDTFKPELLRDKNGPKSLQNMVSFAWCDVLLIIMDESGLAERADSAFEYLGRLASSP